MSVGHRLQNDGVPVKQTANAADLNAWIEPVSPSSPRKKPAASSTLFAPSSSMRPDPVVVSTQQSMFVGNRCVA